MKATGKNRLDWHYRGIVIGTPPFSVFISEISTMAFFVGFQAYVLLES